MSTSGTYNFSVTRDQVIQQAMKDLGVLGESEVPSAQEATDCSFKLNMLVKQWMGKQDFAPGLKMWKRQRGDLFLGNTKFQYQLGPSGDNWAGGISTGSTLGANYGQTTTTSAGLAGATTLNITSNATMTNGDQIGFQAGADIFWTTITSSTATSVTIPSSPAIPATASGAYVWNYTTKQQRPLEILTVILRDINNADIPLNRMTLEDYEILPTKTMSTFTSDPMAFYYESQLTNGQFYIDVGGAQDITKHLHIVYLQPIQDFDNPTDNPEYPQQWYRALCWGLAKDIAPMFDAEWTDEMEGNFRDAMAMAKEADAETSSFYFQPYAGTPYEP